ncbi:hypothetical protein TVAG_487920 [Trichomonas vaginalis G3]|uniref:FPL domain-containing protein n=1 Tax=Trichomonas vaginalis (strain ATCC PRA-98 / G3) TaxID=412133 RepID=A2E6I5_TRIV3|nr:protein CLEC16A family [Trichomonas vaginalis G3]EAY11690.1 hypothetical protein TVAG_487920 [Trichomonas vaginalis G3]KAI5488874.1 protein CLEC16A family [Trichomonas vaginalis G3]|eukprot:XP_001323913.1 hypothetical protein [Trichomonas vaginalis G3]
MLYEAINLASTEYLAKPNDSTQASFFDAIDKIPEIFSKSTESFGTKLTKLKNSQFFSAIYQMLKSKISDNQQLQLLKLMDFLITTASKKEDIEFIFSNDLINTIISCKFNWSLQDNLLAYTSFLKNIATKLPTMNVNYIFTQYPYSLPLYLYSTIFLTNPDSIVVSAARFVILQLCNLKNPEINDYIDYHIPTQQLEKLVSIDEIESIDYIIDLLRVAPLRFTKSIEKYVKNKLNSSGPEYMVICFQNFMDSPLKSMIIQTLNEKLLQYDYSQILNLGILLYSVENKYMTLDTAIQLGFIAIEKFEFVQLFAPITLLNPKPLVSEILIKLSTTRFNALVLTICLKIWEKIYKNQPFFLYDILQAIVKEMKKNLSMKLVRAFIEREEVNIRTDLNFIKENVNYPDYNWNSGNLAPLIDVLLALQLSISRWTKIPISFQFPEINFEIPEISFSTSTNNSITISSSFLSIDNTKIELMRFDVKQGKTKRNLELVIFDRKKFGSLEKKSREIEFETTTIAEQFVEEVEKRQLNNIRVLLAGYGC